MAFKTYYMLTKPGIIMGNVLTTAAGFAMASRHEINLSLFFSTLIGLSLVIASAGVFNNYIDRASDAKMSRTKNRPFVTGLVSTQGALIFASLLGFAGFFVLIQKTNGLAAAVAGFGFLVYLVLYAFMKYHSFYGTLVGSLAGAVPPVVGYCAVSNRLDAGAILLFLILVLWQMPHFFAIAMYRFQDYASANIPVLPVQKGAFATKVQMVLYVIAFTATALMLTVLGYTGNIYFTVSLLLGLSWLALCFTGFKINNETLWARKMFLYSLVVIMGLCLTITLDVI